MIVGTGAALAARCTRVFVALVLAGAFVVTSLAASADASVFVNGVRWPTRADGYTIIPVCMAGASTTRRI